MLAQTLFPLLPLLSGFAALCVARIVREAPRWAALLCAAAIVPVTVIHLVPPLAYLSTPQPSFSPQTMGLGDFMPPLLTWLVIVTPLAVSIVLALRQPRHPREQARRGSFATGGRRGRSQVIRETLAGRLDEGRASQALLPVPIQHA
ncbi:MAG: hypothetical protein IMZ75_11010, partial [Actinobacteria bacterium]|nr:hypothetical protein [Actinomycetota bacterium]